MSQVLLRVDQIHRGLFELDGKEAHHVLRVMRKKVGDKLALFDGKGGQFQGVVTKIDPALPAIHGRLLNDSPAQKAPSKTTRIRLFQGLPKGSKIDYVIEKATELGVDEIIPFLSEKSLIKLDDKQAASKKDRWTRIAEAAAKQCDRSDIPDITEPRKLMDLGEVLKEGFSLVFTDQNSKSLRVLMPKDAAVINLLVGPESGFSKGELIWLQSQGAKPVSLGNLTLRTETAGLAALALVNYEMGQFDS